MDSLLQSSGTIIAVIFAVAVIYSLYTTIRKKDKAENAEKALEGRKHTHAVNLHSHDLKPHNGYLRYDVQATGYTHRYPNRFVAVALDLAAKQPYSIYKLAFAEFENGEPVDRHYFYIQPPENDLSQVTDKAVNWQVLTKADTFGEYWKSGMKDIFEHSVLVAHNAPFVIGCILHALEVYDIKVEKLRYVDALETAKELYNFDDNSLVGICNESGFEVEPDDELSKAVGLGKFFALSHSDYPTALPRIYAYGTAPTDEEIMAAAIAEVEREADTPEAMFSPLAVNERLLKTMVDKGYLEDGERPGTYYATDKGLDFTDDIAGL